MALPLMVRAMRLSIEAVDRRLEGAARTLGAGRWRVFWTITLPLSLPGVLAGAVLGFARVDRRVRRDDHLRLERAGRDADAAAGDLCRAAAARRRRDRAAAVGDLGAALAGGAGRVGTARAAERAAGSMSFDIDVAKRLGDDRDRAAARARARGYGAVRPVGRRQDQRAQHGRRAAAARRGHIASAARRCSTRAIDLPPERRRAGYVFQDARLFPHLRVARQPALRPARATTTGRRGRALLGIGHLLDRWPRTLSGGEAQRVAIGRALLSDPRSCCSTSPCLARPRAPRGDRARDRARARRARPADPDGHARPRRSRAAGDADRRDAALDPAQEVHLADGHALHAEDIVGGGDVEIEVRRCEAEHVRQARRR